MLLVCPTLQVDIIFFLGLSCIRRPRLSPDDRWDRLQPPRDPTDRLSGYRKWMDGWMY